MIPRLVSRGEAPDCARCASDDDARHGYARGAAPAEPAAVAWLCPACALALGYHAHDITHGIRRPNGR